MISELKKLEIETLKKEIECEISQKVQSDLELVYSTINSIPRGNEKVIKQCKNNIKLEDLKRELELMRRTIDNMLSIFSAISGVMGAFILFYFIFSFLKTQNVI